MDNYNIIYMYWKEEKMNVNIIGAGLAGTECAYMLAKNDIKVTLYEMKRCKKTDAHKSDNYQNLFVVILWSLRT